MSTPGTGTAELRSFVERIQRLEAEIAEINSDKRDIYAEAKSKGFDVPALKAVIAYLRKDPAEAEERRVIFDLYLAHAQGSPEPSQSKKRTSDALKPAARPSNKPLARAHETEPAVTIEAQPKVPAADGETWPVDSLSPGPLIEAAPPGGVGAEDGGAAMPVAGHSDNFLSIPEFLRRPLPEATA